MKRLAQEFCTASKHRSQWLETHPKEALGYSSGRLVTEQGLKIDMCCSLGANLNGFQNSFSLSTPYEEELADRIHKVIPCCEKIKILKTGTDACNAAVRIARGYNPGNDDIGYTGIGTGYHGWGNSFIASEKPGVGCEYESYQKCDSLQHIQTAILSENVNYCIIEPFELDYSKKTINQLKEIRRLCSAKKIVLIFDEVITGFRTPQYCVSNFVGVKPDLICLGKALGNGFPISILGGLSSIMDTPDYFISGTFFGETQAIKEALKTLDFLSETKLQEFWNRGRCFQKNFNALTSFIQLQGLPTRAVWKGKWHLPFIQEMNRRGYLLHPKCWFLNFEHDEDILNKFMNNARCVIKNLAMGKIKLIGKEPQPIFKRI